ncbi:MAG: histidine phosphatase family protein [bacterium]
MRLILVRHGQTDWNLIKRIQSYTDVPLNDVGREQAHQVAIKLRDIKIDVIYSSPLSRAYESAKIIAKYHDGIKIIKEPAFTELNMGKWEGMFTKEAQLRIPECRQWLEDPFSVTPPLGESTSELKKRVISKLSQIIKSSHDKTICLVAHQMTNTIIKCHYQNLPFRWNLLPQNADWEEIIIR